MRLRLLAFVPPATLISAAVLISASSLVSALESNFTYDAIPTISLERFESRCDGLDREIEALSRAATNCDQDIQCLASPILCPIAMNEEAEREYLALREERREHCGVSSSSPEFSLAPTNMESNACRSTLNWLESATDGGSAGPPVFDF